MTDRAVLERLAGHNARLAEIDALCDSVLQSPWSDDPYVNASFLAEDIKAIIAGSR
jgi:hypothetical protein